MVVLEKSCGYLVVSVSTVTAVRGGPLHSACDPLCPVRCIDLFPLRKTPRALNFSSCGFGSDIIFIIRHDPVNERRYLASRALFTHS